MTKQRVVAALVGLVAFSVVGCGFDPGDAPVEAKTEDFCTAWARLAKAGAGTSADSMEEYLSEFARFGTPRGIPTAARNGFEYVIDQEYSSGAAFAAAAKGTDGNGQDVAALFAYAEEKC